MRAPKPSPCPFSSVGKYPFCLPSLGDGCRHQALDLPIVRILSSLVLLSPSLSALGCEPDMVFVILLFSSEAGDIYKIERVDLFKRSHPLGESLR